MTDRRNPKPRALDQALRAMFRSLQARPVPARLRSVVDQLDEGDPQPAAKMRRNG